MAKKNKLDDRPFCDSCAHADWHNQEWNLDKDGNPITFWCARNIFEHGEVRGTRRACGKYKPRYTQSMGTSIQRARQLYRILIDGGKLNKEERAELDDYESRFKKDKYEPCV